MEMTMPQDIQEIAAGVAEEVLLGNKQRELASVVERVPCTCGYDTGLDAAITAVINYKALDLIPPDAPAITAERDNLVRIEDPPRISVGWSYSRVNWKGSEQ